MRITSVLISDEIDAICPKILADHGINVVQKSKLTEEQLKHEIAEHDALIVRSATKVSKEVLRAGTNLKLVGRAGTGVDNIDVPEATRLGVVVVNTPAGNSRSAAELACLLILNLARRLPQAHQSIKDGKWERKRFMGSEVSGKTLAVIGLGRIGREVASRMQAFGMTIIGYDPFVSAEKALEMGIQSATLEEIWPQADYITVHVPLIAQTSGLINEAVFAKTKPGVRIVNCARGGIVDEDHLLAALESGVCAGAALDVFVQEPPMNKRLIANPNVICSPHLGASTDEAQFRVAEEVAEQIVAFNNGQPVPGALNAAALLASFNPSTASCLKTMENLSAVLAALAKFCNHQLKSVHIEYPECCQGVEAALRAATAIGLLKSSCTNGLNFVNADTFAQANGITLTTKHGKDKQIAVSCANSDDLRVSGANLSQIGPMIFSIGQFMFPTGILCQGAVAVTHQGDLIKSFVDNQENCLGIVRSRNVGAKKCYVVLCDSLDNMGEAMRSQCATVEF